jgi:cyclase
MLRKRIVFTLLYDDGYFMLSRNFRLQRVGNVEWLFRNYRFEETSGFIDELIVLDVTRGERNHVEFSQTLKSIARHCFIPIAAGGGVRSVTDAKKLLLAGADKIVVNTLLLGNLDLVRELTVELGQQCIVGSIDAKKHCDGSYRVFNIGESGTSSNLNVTAVLSRLAGEQVIGELYLNSVDSDGTAQGFDFALLDLVPKGWPVPIILSGGAGNVVHLSNGLSDPRVSAVATAHLHNFVGNGLQDARVMLIQEGVDLATWPSMYE